MLGSFLLFSLLSLLSHYGEAAFHSYSPLARKLSSLSFPPIPDLPKPLGSPLPSLHSPPPVSPPTKFSPAPDATIDFVPTSSPSEVPLKPPTMAKAPSGFSLPPSFSPFLPPPPAVNPHPISYPPSPLPPTISLSPISSPPSPFSPLLPPHPIVDSHPISSPPLPLPPTISPLPASPSPLRRSPLPPPLAMPPLTSPPAGQKRGLWCVAKPTVPVEKLQEAMDYACGEGGADCKEIRPDGSCYYPDNAVAHASFAFNSYWQKNKQSGGSCSFHGTALLVNSDPSFPGCQYVLNQEVMNGGMA